MDDTPVAPQSPTAAPGARPDASPAVRSAKTSLAVIAAVARNRVIGAGNAMPWHIPAELKHFRALTTGHRIVMGRRTWESIGRPLPGRDNVIVTRDARFAVPPGCSVAATLEEALEGNTLPPPVFCIGGAQLYAAALPLADELYLTEIDADFAGETQMPSFERDQWQEDSRSQEVDPASGLHYAFVHYARIAGPARLPAHLPPHLPAHLPAPAPANTPASADRATPSTPGRPA